MTFLSWQTGTSADAQHLPSAGQLHVALGASERGAGLLPNKQMRRVLCCSTVVDIEAQ